MIFRTCRICQEINLTENSMAVIIALTNRERVGDHSTWFQTGSALGASSQEVLLLQQ
jgi:hypothetical protein